MALQGILELRVKEEWLEIPDPEEGKGNRANPGNRETLERWDRKEKGVTKDQGVVRVQEERWENRVLKVPLVLVDQTVAQVTRVLTGHQGILARLDLMALWEQKVHLEQMAHQEKWENQGCLDWRDL